MTGTEPPRKTCSHLGILNGHPGGQESAAIQRKPLPVNQKRWSRSLEFTMRCCLYSRRFPDGLLGTDAESLPRNWLWKLRRRLHPGRNEHKTSIRSMVERCQSKRRTRESKNASKSRLPGWRPSEALFEATSSAKRAASGSECSAKEA